MSHRACGVAVSRHASRYVSSAITKPPLGPKPFGKKQSLPFTCRPTRGRLRGSLGVGGSGSMNTTRFGGVLPSMR
jgi:hypothetical protein